jgi:hypothetical protein
MLQPDFDPAPTTVRIHRCKYEDDNIFVVDGAEAIPVNLDSPYGSPFGANDFRGGKLEFSENIYDKYDPTCCLSGGEITGTYKIVEDTTKTLRSGRSSSQPPPESHLLGRSFRNELRDPSKCPETLPCLRLLHPELPGAVSSRPM